jgi:GrpB-like predicted nucleotidyltransferase (UPF0157 family)
MSPDQLHFRPTRALRGIENAFDEERGKIERLLPGAEVLHTGATSVPAALTRGDLDIHVRVWADGFSEARDKLAVVYTSYSADMWTAGFAAFVAPASRIASGVALTAVGGEHDRRFVVAWDRLKRNPQLLEDYNALKVQYEGSPDADSYEAAKSAFFSALVQADTVSPDLLDGNRTADR